GQGLLVALGEERFAGITQPIGEGRGAEAALLPPIHDEPLRFQLFQMVTDGVRGDAELGRELLGGERLSPLQLVQDVAAQSLVGREVLLGIAHEGRTYSVATRLSTKTTNIGVNW